LNRDRVLARAGWRAGDGLRGRLCQVVLGNSGRKGPWKTAAGCSALRQHDAEQVLASTYDVIPSVLTVVWRSLERWISILLPRVMLCLPMPQAGMIY
jgi:hypothetical protein